MCAHLTNPDRYPGYRFPKVIIHRALWLLNRFNLSLRGVQEPSLKRGITVSHETLHDRNQKFAVQVSFQTGTVHRMCSRFNGGVGILCRACSNTKGERPVKLERTGGGLFRPGVTCWRASS
jgi:transposase-like protein